MTTYIDKAECPDGHRFSIRRKVDSAGRTVDTRCPSCDRSFKTQAGPAGAATAGPTLERQIEARLVKRVGELGGEVRKVQWVGRRSAPDRLVMLPANPLHPRMLRPQTIWVELKAPGGAATFPKNAHERAQHREHERMRQMGQRVVVVDSYEQIEELLK